MAEISPVAVPWIADLPLDLYSTMAAVHVHPADQMESVSAPPHCQSSGADGQSPDDHFVDHVDGDPQLQNVDQMESFQHVDETDSCDIDFSVYELESFRRPDEVNSDQYDHFVDDAEQILQSRNLDQLNSDQYGHHVDQDKPLMSQNVDQVKSDQYDHVAPAEPIHQSQNVDQSESVLATTTLDHHASPVQIIPTSSLPSFLPICSMIGVAIFSCAVAVYLLRSTHRSKP